MLLPPVPVAWVTTLMRDGENQHLSRLNPIKKGVGEPLDQQLVHSFLYFRTDVRVLG